MLPVERREVEYRNFVFHLKNTSRHDASYYMRIKTTSSVSLPLVVMSGPELSKKIAHEQFLLGMNYGFLFVIAIYTLFIFVSIRELSYLYYIIWIFGYGLYQFTLNGLSFQYLWPDSVRWGNISLPFFIFFGAASGVYFCRSFLNTNRYTPKIDKFLLGIFSVTVLGCALTFILPYKYSIKFATSSVVPVTVSLLSCGIFYLINGYRAARFYVIAYTMLLLGIILYAFKTFGLLPVNMITNWSQQVGSAIEVALLSLALADRINMIKREKRTEQEGRLKAQEKFRLLFESDKDIIMTLNKDLRIETVNQAIKTQLRMKPDDIIGKPIHELVFVGDDNQELTRKSFREKLDKFLSDKNSMTIKTQFSTFYNNEPKEMQLRFEFISIGGKDEILVKASTVQEDALLKYLECERQRLWINNYLSTAEDVSYRITRNIVKFINQRELNFLRIALREMIVNAIEHGNLGITFEEKSEAIIEDRYFEMLAIRQRDPRYESRKVEIYYAIDNEKVTFRITDEGEGFDHQTFLQNNSRNANTLLRAHGRGITMSKNYFDEICYNRRGNQVLLVKRFNGAVR
jgi:anti-sigma regulatory factor (Ser/Thr protein kinase)